MSETEINLNFYGSQADDPQAQALLAHMSNIKSKIEEGKPVFVNFTDDRREGSIGRIVEFDYSVSSRVYNSTFSGRQTYVYVTFHKLVVGWDGRKNRINPHPSEIRYLPDFVGETNYVWKKPDPKDRPPPVIPYDHLGEEIKQGQFVCFVHKKYGITDLMFGTVSRTTPKGSVFVKSIKLREEDRESREVKALSASDLVIVNDKLLSRLTLARLATS